MQNTTLNEILQIAEQLDKIGLAIETLLEEGAKSPVRKLTAQLRRCAQDIEQEMTAPGRIKQFELDIEVKGVRMLYSCDAENILQARESVKVAFPGATIVSAREALTVMDLPRG